MNGKIYKIKDNDELIAIHEEKHHNENHFQELLFSYPDLIPGDQVDSENPRRWLRVGREINNIDIFLLDQDGIPTIVEVKKSNNSEIHREVVGQMLDYGSKLVFSQSAETILPQIEANNPQSVQDFLDNEMSEEEFWKKVDNNLKEEKMRLIVVSDEIPRNLQNIIEFLNSKIESTEVLALEIKQFTDNATGTRTLVPRLMGQTRIITPIEPELVEKTFFENLDDVGVEFFRELITFADANNLTRKWTRKGFFLTVPLQNREVNILQCYSQLYSYGQSVFSTHFNLITEVKDGDIIFKKSLEDIMELEDFYRLGNDFGFKVVKNLDEYQWTEFKRIILEMIKSIEKNGLI
ncbi:MAG: hypothetical protein ACC609_01290 [Methanobacterium formicicum]